MTPATTPGMYRCTPQEQLRLVQMDPWAITQIEAPCWEAVEHALEHDVHTKAIPALTESVQIQLATQMPAVACSLEALYPAVQMLLVETAAENALQIENLCQPAWDKLVLTFSARSGKLGLLSSYPNYAERLNHASIEAQKEILQAYPNDLVFIRQQSDEVVDCVLNLHASYIRHVKHQTPAQQAFAYERDPFCFHYLVDPPREIALQAAGHSVANFEYIANPDVDMWRAALPHMIEYEKYFWHKNPPREIICEMLSRQTEIYSKMPIALKRDPMYQAVIVDKFAGSIRRVVDPAPELLLKALRASSGVEVYREFPHNFEPLLRKEEYKELKSLLETSVALGLKASEIAREVRSTLRHAGQVLPQDLPEGLLSP